MNRRTKKSGADLPIWRRRIVIGLFVLAVGALESRLVWLQLMQGDYLSAEAEERQFRRVEIAAHRGMLTDRHGDPLAVSTPLDSIVVNPQAIGSNRDAIYALAAAVGLDGAAVERRITSNNERQFLYIERQMPPAEAARVMELGIKGVWKVREYGRFNPAHEVTSHLVGYTDIDDIGQEGLEAIYDHLLRGQPGEKIVQQDLEGREIGDVALIEAARPGRYIRTSIDMKLQYPAYVALKTAIQQHGASWGSVVLLDAVTGEVLAMANQPTFNPNDTAQRTGEEVRNRAITDIVEPGSTIKPLILAAALANGYSPDDIVDVPQVFEIDGERITYEDRPLGLASLTEILAASSNPGMAKIGSSLEPRVLWQTLTNLGIGRATDSGLSGRESLGSLDDYRSWRAQRHATISYGYGLSVTPLQLARAYAAIASGGMLPPISLLALDEPPERTQAIDPEVADQIMRMMEVVVSDQGTGSRAAIANFRVAGKTGTARVAQSGGYSDDQYHAIFAGVAPASNPRFVCVVVISDPRGQAYHGGDVAAPVFSKVVGTALRLHAVEPDALVEPEIELLSHAGVGR